MIKIQEIKPDFNRYVGTWSVWNNDPDGREICMFTAPRTGQALLFDCALTVENLLIYDVVKRFADTGYFRSLYEYAEWVICGHFLGTGCGSVDFENSAKNYDAVMKSEFYAQREKDIKFEKTKFNLILFDEYNNNAVKLEEFNF